jgi:CHAT domain-containing protein
LLVVGNPEFTRRQRRPDVRVSSRVRGTLACFDPKALQFDPLPSSQAEAEQILKAWKNAGGTGHLMAGAQATEAAFRSSAPRHQILHLATHGFFYQTRCDGNGAAAAPLAISGLALAGVNAHPVSPDDGLLTADEVSMMALENTEWAVLSGCETGLGKIEAGEGVFGLRRAFQLAGARTIIMSLSPVQDEWARRWMTTLYRNRLQRRMPTPEAVRTASLSLLEQRRRAGLSTHPIYWAAFVAAGDWR